MFNSINLNNCFNIFTNPGKVVLPSLLRMDVQNPFMTDLRSGYKIFFFNSLHLYSLTNNFTGKFFKKWELVTDSNTRPKTRTVFWSDIKFLYTKF